MSTFSENLSRTARRAIVGAGLMALLAAPAVADEEEISDPLEAVNRVTSGFNDLLRTFVVDPLIGMYQGVTPRKVQDAVSNAASNLTEPVTAASSLLQGDVKSAGTATKRFMINSTIGLGGIQDKAKEMGLEQRREDLGQALGKHGIAPGPHIVLPLLGPSNLRDATADIATGLASPIPLAGKAALGAAFQHRTDNPACPDNHTFQIPGDKNQVPCPRLVLQFSHSKFQDFLSSSRSLSFDLNQR